MPKKYFFTVQRGQFVERTNNGRYECFDSIHGHLVNITYKGNTHGELIRLHIVDENNFYLLSMFVNSRSAHAFYMFIKNMDISRPAAFKIKSVEGKDVFYVMQQGNSLRWYFGADTGRQLPRPIEERLSFLKNMIQTEIVPALQKKLNPYPANTIYKPFGKGLQGGYFDNYENNGKVIGPVSNDEREYYEQHGY